MDRANGAFDATTEFASVERCSEPDTRPRKRSPATTLLANVERCSAWSDVHGRGPRFPERRDPTRRIEHRSTRTRRVPGRAVAGSFTKGRRSGCEHGSTLASSVVAPESADDF
jgi:hypothetical protein